MKTKRILYFSAMLLMSMSCKKVPNFDCNDGTCCSLDKHHYIFIQTISNEPVDAFVQNGSIGLFFKNPIQTTSGPDSLLSVCSLSLTQATKIKNTYIFGTSHPYKYRVWGKVFQNADITTIGPPYFLYLVLVERIEEII